MRSACWSTASASVQAPRSPRPRRCGASARASAGTKGVVDYDWAPDGKTILVPIDGDLYLASLDGSVRRLTDTPQSEIDAHVSEGGRYVSFVRDQNLIALDLTTGREKPLTKEGGGTVTCGTAEFVAQEEMDRTTGTWWAPGDGHVRGRMLR